MITSQAQILFLTLTTALTVSGCAPVKHGDDSQATSSARQSVARTDESDSAAAPDVKSSVVKVLADTPTCNTTQRINTGFVVAPHRVITVAHVVAGADSVSIELDGAKHVAQVILFDPTEDIAVLEVADLAAKPLAFAETPASDGADASLPVYRGTSVVETPIQIRETIELNGPDIYRTAIVHRWVYTFRGNVKQGDAGAPVVDNDGHVLGVAFGAAVDDDNTGFALTAKEISPHLGTSSSPPVGTGRCTQ